MTLANGTGYIYVIDSASPTAKTYVSYILNRSGQAITINNGRKAGSLGIECYVDGSTLPSNSSATVYLGDGSAVTILENSVTDNTFSQISLPNTRTDLQYLLTTFQ